MMGYPPVVHKLTATRTAKNTVKIAIGVGSLQCRLAFCFFFGCANVFARESAILQKTEENKASQRERGMGDSSHHSRPQSHSA